MGTLSHTIQVSAVLTTVTDAIEIRNKEIDHILSLLPKNTKVRSIEDGTIVSLAIPFIVTFEHPLFNEDTVLELEYLRTFYIENKKVIEGSVLTGFKLSNLGQKIKSA